MSALTIAIPSKGRLQEQTLDYLADAGLRLAQTRGARDYTAKLSGAEEVAVSLLSAVEIADELIAGRVHLGVTGEDLLAEHNAGGRAVVLERLGFGRANVVVAVPQSWIDVSTMADLDDVAATFHVRHHRKLKVATKFINIARGFFASHGIADYRIVESLGATEGAPAAGTAEVIVDITTTGATLTANQLKILDDGTILESEASLAASVVAKWNQASREAASALFDRLVARAKAKTSQIIDVHSSALTPEQLSALMTKVGAELLSRPGDQHLQLLVPEKLVSMVIKMVREAAPDKPVTTHIPNQVFSPENAMFQRLEAALSKSSVG